MKIKSFSQFLNEFEIEGELQSKPIWNGKDYLDSDGDIDLSNMNLTELPCIFPEIWGKGFFCYNNRLTSLFGAPKKINGTFNCNYNRLTSLNDAPRLVIGDFYCSDNSTNFTKRDVELICDVRGYIYTK